MEPSTPLPPLPPPSVRAPLPPVRRVLPPKPPVVPTLQQQLFTARPRDLSIFLLLLLVGALGLMGWSYFSSLRPVRVILNGKQTLFLTRQATVRSTLVEAGFIWNSEDIIRPALDEPLPDDGRVVIQVAAPVTLQADGNTLERRTQSTTVAGVLKENGIQLKMGDRVYLNGHIVDANAKLPPSGATLGRRNMPPPAAKPALVSVERSVPVSINDNGLTSTIYTTERTLGAALNKSGLLVYLGDEISPDLGSPVTAGSEVFIRRSRPASIMVDSRLIKTRTRSVTVADLLTQEGVQLEGKDYTDPSPTSPVLDGTSVNVTRVREVYITETIPITYQVRTLPNPAMEIDTRVVAQEGARGIKNRLFKSVYENGKLISRGLEREWIANPPQDRIINYGTKIVLRDLTLPDGRVVQYWRDIRMFATSYSAATSGKPRSHPEYGLTFLGMTAGKGIVAIDPRVVNLRTNVYVPGYGLAVAGDTGGGIKGKRIDLGYAESELGTASWFRWVDVYLLTPVPPTRQISYTLLDFPVERTGPR